jgi:hypothetical protein
MFVTRPALASNLEVARRSCSHACISYVLRHIQTQYCIGVLELQSVVCLATGLAIILNGVAKRKRMVASP